MDPRSYRARGMLGRAALAGAVGLAVLTGVLGARAYLSLAPESVRAPARARPDLPTSSTW